jgi:hypothetical protein
MGGTNLVFSHSSSVEAGSNSSTVALREVGGDKKGTPCLGYNWDTLYLGDKSTETWPPGLGESRS